jgi:predicted phosphohydrolase
MKIWAIGDLHLSFGVPNKGMDLFGWNNHAERIQQDWESKVHPDDLVLIPGDISWAMRLEEAKPDLEWLDRLPGTKVMIKGNHDYWWGSLKKVVQMLPPSIHVIQNNSFLWKDVAIGGARLWDSPEYSFGQFITMQKNPKAQEKLIQDEMSQKLFDKELERLKLSLSSMKEASVKIAMTHYPPIGADLQPTRASQILEQHGIQVCVFGHLHNLHTTGLFGTARGVRYVLTSADYLDFKLIAV